MGLNHVTLENEAGKRIGELVADPGVLDALLAEAEQEPGFEILREIDPYGYTVFNRVQIDRFLLAWHRFFERAQTSAQKSVINEVARLAQQCQDEPHLYLRFHGD